MQLVTREILFDVMQHKHDVHLAESDNSSMFQEFCKKATTQYKTSTNMSNFAIEMLEFMKFNKSVIRYVGQGSSRVVFVMGDGTALKLAKTISGIAQNKQEAKICMNPNTKYTIFPDFYGADEQYWLALNCELCAPATENDFKELFKCQPKSISNIIEFIIKMNIQDFQLKKLIDYYNNMNNPVYANFTKLLIDSHSSAIEAIRSLIDFYRTYGLDELLLGDVEEIENWGIVIRNNQKMLVILDAGFNENVYQNFYK